MSALVAGFLLIGYLLAPGVIYRLFFSAYIPARRYQRTRTEEVVFSLLVTILPFLFSWILLIHTPLGQLPAFGIGPSKAEAYRAVFRSLLPGPDVTGSNPFAVRAHLSEAYLRAFLEQGRFISLLWLFCGAEGWLSGFIVSKYGDYRVDQRMHRLLKRFCDDFLLTYVSEWELLFTTRSLPRSQRDFDVEIDALAADILYRGKLVDWFLDQDGKLEGIFLERAARYQQKELERDREHGTQKPRDSYWRTIPGAKLYLVASTIANYNIRYVPPSQPEMTLADLRARLGDDAIVTPLPQDSFEDPLNSP
ncbi:hypothetical protein [Granulicella sp. S190]|uniref:hypothetical protein n=1 Tax=Granulicella sp. S190 TaxID=1747226 RepID=UPI00131AB60D|nr:hypothetical protein [Granulicella sp. S190]